MCAASAGWSRCRAAITVSGTMLVLFACTTVRIESALDPAAVRVDRHWGVVAVHMPGAMPSYVAEVSSLGFSQTPFGWTAGYARQGWAALGSECRLVVWVATPEHLEAARALADAQAGLCTVSAP